MDMRPLSVLSICNRRAVLGVALDQVNEDSMPSLDIMRLWFCFYKIDVQLTFRTAKVCNDKVRK